MSQLSALTANHKRLKRLPYSIITVPRPGWMFHNVSVVLTVLNLSLTSFSTSAAGTPGGTVGAGVAVGALVGGTAVGGAVVGSGGGAVGVAGAGLAQLIRIRASPKQMSPRQVSCIARFFMVDPPYVYSS